VPNARVHFHGSSFTRSDGEFIVGRGRRGKIASRARRKGSANIRLVGDPMMSSRTRCEDHEAKRGGRSARGFPKRGQRVRLTAMDVGRRWRPLRGRTAIRATTMHHSTKRGKLSQEFGGKKEPYGFKTWHKIAVDTRLLAAHHRLRRAKRARGATLSVDGIPRRDS